MPAGLCKKVSTHKQAADEAFQAALDSQKQLTHHIRSLINGVWRVHALCSSKAANVTINSESGLEKACGFHSSKYANCMQHICPTTAHSASAWWHWHHSMTPVHVHVPPQAPNMTSQYQSELHGSCAVLHVIPGRMGSTGVHPGIQWNGGQQPASWSAQGAAAARQGSRAQDGRH